MRESPGNLPERTSLLYCGGSRRGCSFNVCITAALACCFSRLSSSNATLLFGGECPGERLQLLEHLLHLHYLPEPQLLEDQVKF